MPPHAPRPARRLAVALAALLAVLLTGACAAPRKPAPPPPLRVELDHFAGTVLTGPTAEEPVDATANAALGLELRVALLPRSHAGEPLPVRLVVVDGFPDPFRTRSELARGARCPSDDADDAPLWSHVAHAALPPGATAVIAFTPEPTAPDVPRPAWERLEVEVARRGDDPARLELALDLSGLVPLRVEEEPGLDEPARPRAPQLVRTVERVVLDAAPHAGAPPWRLELPAPTTAAPDAVLALELATTASASDAAVAQAREQIEASRREAAERAEGLSGQEGFRIQSTSALDALSRREVDRPALLYLAGETGAQLVAELALVADVETLGDVLAAARERLAALEQPTLEPATLGWLFESTAWSWLATAAASDDEAHALAPELRALLLRKAGEAGRWPDLLQDAVSESDGVEALTARLESENRIFLEDADPAARVRAFDWLDARGLAPEGYDPLASSQERRDALARLEAAREAAAGAEEAP